MTSPTPVLVCKPSTYPDALIIPALQDHKQTIIILHGRGSNAATFASPLLNTEIKTKDDGTIQTFRSAVPNAKFIFPTAAKRRARCYNRARICQWFDNGSLTTPDERTEWQVQGLRESCVYIHSLLRNAIDQVGAKNVVLGGLSQGCATALIALLTWDGEPIAAGFGMCGWLPFRKQIEDILIADERVEGDAHGMSEDDVFEREGDGGGEGGHAAAKAIAFLKEELEMEEIDGSMAVRRIPLFLGHGVEDERVPVGLGREAAGSVERMGARVEWREYEGLGHWYSAEVLCDLVKNLKETTGWGNTEGAE
ncbi:MAG: hypothetical protein Q9221_008426 [Calogaya cf. arnoldii]